MNSRLIREVKAVGIKQELCEDGRVATIVGHNLVIDFSRRCANYSNFGGCAKLLFEVPNRKLFE